MVIRTIGRRAAPSARTMPPDVRPTSGAESRPDRTPTHVPSLTMSTAWAGTPSSSYPKLPSAPGQGGVGGDVHEVGAVAHRTELGGVEPRGARERGLPPEDPVELDGVPDRLVDLERHLLAAQDQGGGLLRALRRAEQGPRLLGDARRVAERGRARAPAPSRGCRTGRARPGSCAAGSRRRRSRWRRSRRRTPRCAGRCGCPRWTRTTSPCPRSGGWPAPGGRPPSAMAPVTSTSRSARSPMPDVVERVHLVGVRPARLHHGRRRQVHRRAGHPGAGPGHLGGPLAGASGRGVGELRGGLEAPRRSDQRPHADPGGLGLGEALDHPVLRAHRLVADDHHARVRVPGTGGERGLDGRGGEVVHRRHRTGAASGPLGRSRPRPAPSRSRAPRPT